MSEHVQFELVSPERLLASRAVSMVTIPGAEGDLGVLPGHAPLIVSLRAGVIDIYDGAAVSERLFTAGGFAEITDSRCTVLAQDAVPLAELNNEALQTEARRLQDALSTADTEQASALTEQLSLVQTKLAILAAA